MTDFLLPPAPTSAAPASGASAPAAPQSAWATAASALQALPPLLQSTAPDAATQAAAQLRAGMAALHGLPEGEKTKEGYVVLPKVEAAAAAQA